MVNWLELVDMFRVIGFQIPGIQVIKDRHSKITILLIAFLGIFLREISPALENGHNLDVRSTEDRPKSHSI